MYHRKYQPQPVRRVEIPKPNGGTRKLGIPIVLDRVIQQVMMPMFEPHFSEYSYGFRPKRSCQQLVNKFLKAGVMVKGEYADDSAPRAYVQVA